MECVLNGEYKMVTSAHNFFLSNLSSHYLVFSYSRGFHWLLTDNTSKPSPCRHQVVPLTANERERQKYIKMKKKELEELKMKTAEVLLSPLSSHASSSHFIPQH